MRTRTNAGHLLLALLLTQAFLPFAGLNVVGALAFALAWRQYRGEMAFNEPSSAQKDALPPRLTIAFLLVILLLGCCFRLFLLTRFPPGLYIDEVQTARNALLWRLGTAKNWSMATPLREAGGVETSNLYLAYASLIMDIFGDGLIGVRMISVLPSLLCIPLVYWLSIQLWDRRTALLAAFLLAASHWAVRTGRTGWDQVVMTALQLLSLAALLHALRQDRIRYSCLAGIGLGLGLYTYIASRLVVAHVLVWAICEVIASNRRRRTACHFGAALGIAAVLAAPHVHYLLCRSPTALSLRASELLFSRGGGFIEGFRILFENIVRHITMFNGPGGLYVRDNLPGAPMLDPVTGILFLFGLLHLLNAPGRRRRLMASWYLICVLGGVLSQSGEGAPYVYRVANLAPWACIVAAVGGATAMGTLLTAFPAIGLPKVRALRTGTLALAACLNAGIIFLLGMKCPDLGPAFGTTEVQVGRWLKTHPKWRPCHVNAQALSDWYPHAHDFWHAPINGLNFYRPVDSLVAIQLAAGLCAEDASCIVRPPIPGKGVHLVSRLPRVSGSHAAVVVPVATAPRLPEFFRVIEQVELRDYMDRALCTVALVSPKPPKQTTTSR